MTHYQHNPQEPDRSSGRTKPLSSLTAQEPESVFERAWEAFRASGDYTRIRGRVTVTVAGFTENCLLATFAEGFTAGTAPQEPEAEGGQ